MQQASCVDFSFYKVFTGADFVLDRSLDMTLWCLEVCLKPVSLGGSFKPTLCH